MWEKLLLKQTCNLYLPCTSVWQETDYIVSYFDNGEEFGGDSDDNIDEAIYWSRL